MKNWAILLTLLVLVSGCNKQGSNEGEEATELTPEERAKQQQIELFDEVMAIHDEVMPKMQDIYNLKVNIRGRLDSIPDLSEDAQADLRNHLAELDSADEAMMNWMREFEPVADSVSHEDAMEYLEDEKSKIEKVREVMNTAISEATEKLNN